jgi:N-acetylneuraminic acid mutarotase
VVALVVAGPAQAGTDPSLASALAPAAVPADPVEAGGGPPDGSGAWVAHASGRVDVQGRAGRYGDLAGTRLAAPVVGMARTPSGHGYWLVAGDGGIFSFGDAGFYGSTGGIPLNQPVVSVAPTASGRGYWLVAADGGVFSFGDAAFHGSTGDVRLNRPIDGMLPTAGGDGYWLVASDGGVFGFGDAGFFGSTGASPPIDDVVALAPTPDGGGYWLATLTGRVLPFGDADALGDLAGDVLAAPVVAMAASTHGTSYVLVQADGRSTWFEASDPGHAKVVPAPSPPPSMPSPPPAAGETATVPSAPPLAPEPDAAVPIVRDWPASWAAASAMPDDRYEAASTVVGGRLFVFGGYHDDEWRVDRTYAAYDPATDTWTTLGTLPPGMAETHVGIATDGVDVYLAGGFAGDIRDTEPSQVITDQLWDYRPSDGTWTSLGTLPRPRGAGTLALVGRTLHYLGGNLADRVTDVADHLTYDLDARTWGEAAPLPDARDHLSSVVLDGKVYVLGGEHGHDVLNEQQDDVHVYDPATDTWTRLASLPVATSHAEGQTSVIDGRIVVAGGQVGSFAPTADVWSYDPATDRWSRLLSLPAARQGAAVHQAGGLVVVAGGALQPSEPQGATWVGHLD